MVGTDNLKYDIEALMADLKRVYAAIDEEYRITRIKPI